MKNRKDQLLEELDQAEAALEQAEQAVQAIHNSVSSYNYTVQVPYIHKSKVFDSDGNSKWNTETRYRDETRFDHESFHQDLNNAIAKLQAAQQQLAFPKATIQAEINRMQSFITQANYLQSDVSNLKTTLATLQSKLAGSKYSASCCTVSSISIVDMISSAKVYLSQIFNAQIQLTCDIANMSAKISTLKSEIDKNAELDAKLTAEEFGKLNKQKAAHDRLKEKYASLSEDARAVLAFEYISTGCYKLLHILEGLGFNLEIAAQIAVSKSQGIAFDYFVKAGAKLDVSINKKETLALYIINLKNSDENDEFVKKLINCNQSLNVTTFMAASSNNFEALNLLLKYNPNSLKEFKDVKVSGLSIIQFAIAGNNNELLEFVMSKDPECFKQEAKGYKNYFHMALIYHDEKVLKTLGKYYDVAKEIKQLIDSSEIELVVKAIKAYELDREQIESLLKYCSYSDDQFAAQSIISNCNIADAQEIFDVMMVGMGSDEPIMGLE